MAAKLTRYSWVSGGLTAALLIVIGRLVSWQTAQMPLEFALYDRVTASSAAPSGDIAIVSIDDASIARLGAWPWSGDVHARLLDRLRADGVRVAAFTVPLNAAQRASELERLRGALALLESSSLGHSEQARQLRRLLGEAEGSDPDVSLEQALARHGNVVLPLDLQVGQHGGAPLELPAKLLLRADADALQRAPAAALTRAPAAAFTKVASAVGHTFIPKDKDGITRADAAAVRLGDTLVPSLALAIAARAAQVAPDQLAFGAGDSLNIAGRAIAVDEHLRVHPHYFSAAAAPGNSQTFARYSYWQVLAGEVPAAQLRDKIVLIGFMDTTLPAASPLATPAGDTPAIIATASTVSSLLSGTVYARPGFASAAEWIAALAVVVFAALALPAAGTAIGALAGLLVIAILVVTEIGLLGSAHVWLHLMLPSIAVVIGFVAHLASDLVRRGNNRTSARSADTAQAAGNLRALGQTFQRQGQLDLAFETYQRCPLDAQTMELLYYLGMDFERRAQLPKASAVYAYIATRDPNYRDLRNRRARVKEEPLTRPVTRSIPPPAPDVHACEGDALESTFPAYTPPARTLGRYGIERELGKGAMGIVYLGRDPKINRVVAIKAIPLAEEFQGDDLAEARARFFREAEMAGRLNHPAIVTVYDAGEDQGLAYIAMEYLRGQHLSHFTDARRLLPYRKALLLIARVADALHYAHRQNVVHRDIKPANIMFDPDTDELKITDFGIARLTDTSRTKTGIVLGTPSFMSPEQLEGRPLDGRSDQFALAVSLYQLLCGQLPFRAESMPRLMHKIATEPHVSVRVLRPELPGCIDAVLERALAKSADDRYVNCAALAAALRSCAGPEDAPQAQTESSHEWLLP